LVAASPAYLRTVLLPESPSGLAADVVILGPGVGPDAWGLAKSGQRS
jgi:hypothetical protein